MKNAFRLAFSAFCLLFASDLHAASDAIPNVTIYARQRPEPMQTVPVSTTTLDKQEIEEERISDPKSLAENVTGFVFNDPFGRYNPSPAIRGMAQPGIGEEPTVAFFQDGIYVSGRSSIDALLFDIDQIEVARGPQNALYGRNSFGGAINFISRMPSSTPRMQLEQTIATSDRFISKAAIEGPLVKDRLLGRLAVINSDRGGFYENATPNSGEIGRERNQGIKGTLAAITPDARTKVVLRTSVINDDDSQVKGFLVPANCQPRSTDGKLRQYCGDLPHGDENNMNADNAVDYGFYRTAWRVSGQVDHQFTDTMLTGTAGLAGEQNKFARDDDYSATIANIAGQYNDRRDYNFDLRWRSDKNTGPWTWLTGTSFYRFENVTKRLDQAVYLGATAPSGARSDAITESMALYGSVGRPVVWGVNATFDARMQTEKKTFDSTIISSTTGRPIYLDDTWSSFIPKATLSKEFAPDFLGYISYAEGFKSGGFNDRANIFDSQRVYNPEKNRTYEVGFKSEWLDHRLRANLTGFYIDWTDQQIVAFSAAGTSNNFYTTNAGRSTSKGVELSLQGKPHHAVDLRLDYSYTDARFDDYKDGELANLPNFAPNGDVSGNLIPRYSPHQLVFDAAYRRTLEPNWGLDGFLGTTFNFQSSQATDTSNLSFTGDAFKINLRSGLKYKFITATLWVDNLLDDRTPPVGIRWQDAANGNNRAWLVVPADGRIVGLTLKSDFGL